MHYQLCDYRLQPYAIPGNEGKYDGIVYDKARNRRYSVTGSETIMIFKNSFKNSAPAIVKR